MKYLERSVEGKKIIWFKENNRYSLVELPAYEVIIQLLEGTVRADIAKWCSVKYNLPSKEALRFVTEIGEMLTQQIGPNETEPGNVVIENPGILPPHCFSQRFYRAESMVFAVEYESEDLEYMVHPKFGHLEIDSNIYSDHSFRLFRQNGEFVLSADGVVAGRWQKKDAHYFTGKFSMELLNCLYGKTDAGWMGVFHASAMSNGANCVMFLGDSGSGKSTIAAILMSAGFDLLADDFVPVDAVTQEVCYFPSAISVKKSAIEFLSPRYPQLLEAIEYKYPGMGKTVRYLAAPVKTANSPFSYPCKALVFITYKPGSGLILDKMPKDVAFQHLVPDSWLSPLPENASLFLDWFLALPCYQLTYSDTEKMLTAVRGLFSHD